MNSQQSTRTNTHSYTDTLCLCLQLIKDTIRRMPAMCMECVALTTPTYKNTGSVYLVWEEQTGRYYVCMADLNREPLPLAYNSAQDPTTECSCHGNYSPHLYTRPHPLQHLATHIKAPHFPTAAAPTTTAGESQETTTQHSNSTRTALMLLLTLGASLALLLIAGNTQGCELMAHLYTRQCLGLNLSKL